jgi:tetratricopeptide (TPR) repeat protein
MRPGDDVAYHELDKLVGDPLTQSMVGRQIELADIVLHHEIGDDYAVAFARSSALAQSCKAARLCVPMIHFSGLQPDMTYIGSAQDRFIGPMGAYHSRIVLTEFLSGHNESTALASFESEEYYESLDYFREFDRSAAELTRRDASCHLAGTPILMKYIHERPTLYTMNRPMNLVFKEIATEAFALLGLDFADVDAEYIPATLSGGAVWPPSVLAHARHGLKFPPSSMMKAGFGSERLLSIEDFVSESYQCYRDGKTRLLRMGIVKTILTRIGLADRAEQDIGAAAPRPDDDSPVTARHRVRRTLADLASVIERTEREPEFARKVANEALWSLPVNGQSLLHVSRILEKLGDKSAAIDVLRGCISRLEEDPKVRTACAEQLLELGAGEILEQELAALNGQKGLKQEVLDFLVRYARRRGRSGLALNAALKMIHTSPNSAIAYLMMAHVGMDAKQPGLAISAIEKALEFEPYNAHHFALRGYALEHLGCRQAAISDYEVAVSLDPEYPAFQQQLERLRGMVHAGTGGGSR